MGYIIYLTKSTYLQVHAYTYNVLKVLNLCKTLGFLHFVHCLYSEKNTKFQKLDTRPQVKRSKTAYSEMSEKFRSLETFPPEDGKRSNYRNVVLILK